jgi:hypothetical protein
LGSFELAVKRVACFGKQPNLYCGALILLISETAWGGLGERYLREPGPVFGQVCVAPNTCDSYRHDWYETC